MLKKIVLVILVILVIIQFIRPARNVSSADTPNAISKHYEVPDTIQKIIRVSCNDCHSNNTHYPWYTNIQPVGWWMQWHVNEGKKHMNYDEFATYTGKRQYKKLDETAEEVKTGEMPLDSYLWIHTDAKLSQGQKDLLINWAEQLSDKIVKDSNLTKEPEKKR